ncbi:hypothetical protein ACFL1R_09270 [Candidatus Latescibacterota bacterium]
MKRREAVKLIPLSLTGIAGLPGLTGARSKLPLGLEYTSKVRDLLERIKSNQSEELLEASHKIAETVRNGNKCYANWDMGHSTVYDIWPDRPGNTDIMSYRIPNDVKKGDLILLDRYHNDIENLHSKGVFIISGPTPWGGNNIGSELLRPDIRAMKLKPFADLWIENYATSYGAIMHVPGETAPLGPVSGVVGMMTLWMMISDAARILAGEGISFKVFGDEPSLKKGDVNVDMARPLGEVYYETAVKQQKAIDDEFTKINDIAAMAVHSVITGGRVYVYSRHSENLCAEGTVRRGGLSLTFGVYGPPEKLILMDDPIQRGIADLSFKPTDRDTVIMGIGKPDDSDDLESLDLFRKAGAGVAAIGPSTRNGIVPSGRTVPNEADIHIGTMCDTYGLFALPGINRKVAPTSGLINNQVFWAVCCQIAEQIIEKTGNTPGIYLSGALKGGMEKLNEVKRLYRERGY